MVCPNCGVPLPDTVSMCYSCRMVFKPMNYPVQPQNTIVNPQPIKKIRLNPAELWLPILAWVIVYITCFCPFFTVRSTQANDSYTGYYFKDFWFMIYLTIGCALYFILMFGQKRIGKKIWQTFICIVVYVIHVIEDTNAYSIFDTAPSYDKEKMAFDYGYASTIFALTTLALIIYTVYTIARDHKK